MILQEESFTGRIIFVVNRNEISLLLSLRVHQKLHQNHYVMLSPFFNRKTRGED